MGLDQEIEVKISNPSPTIMFENVAIGEFFIIPNLYSESTRELCLKVDKYSGFSFDTKEKQPIDPKMAVILPKRVVILPEL